MKAKPVKYRDMRRLCRIMSKEKWRLDHGILRTHAGHECPLVYAASIVQGKSFDNDDYEDAGMEFGFTFGQSRMIADAADDEVYDDQMTEKQQIRRVLLKATKPWWKKEER